MIIWICREVNFLSLSMLSLQFFISVRGVTTIFHFCPGGHYTIFNFCQGGHYNFPFLSRGLQQFLFCLVGHCRPLYMSRRESSIMSSVQGEVYPQNNCPGGTS